MSSDLLTLIKLSFVGYAPSLTTEHSLCVSAPPCQHGNKLMVAFRNLERKLGLTLLAVMINRPLRIRNWHMRMKYDTTAFEIIPRNSVSMPEVVVTPVERF